MDMKKVNYLGKEGQERMIRNGWTLRVQDRCGESPEAMYKRLSEHYSDVRIYWTGTMVRGIHSYFAMCKR